MMDMYKKYPKVLHTDESDLENLVSTGRPATPMEPKKSNNIFFKGKTELKVKTFKKSTPKKYQAKVTRKFNIGRAGNSVVTPPCRQTTKAGWIVQEPKLPGMLPPLGMAPVPLPVPLPIPPPLPIPIYPKVAVMMPMKAYFEPVVHHHPPIYEIQDLIRADEKKWKDRHNRKESETSLERPRKHYSDSSTDSDTSSETDSDTDYYDGVIHLNM
ncbi:unnamed protein product [Chrysodeixis includens]|uniref:Uncharacterized protein n=1 Tax=Chrysodeixis includens TaxID=689277 RepID=A0A9N8KSQ5_CHRIL|nr:unnamed protein product [Chrysodeixis includens]